MIEFYSVKEHLTKDVPIVPANKLYPDWIRNLKNLDYMPTIKTCPGVINLYKRGFIMRSWTNILLKIHPNKTVEYFCEDGETTLTSQPLEQYTGFYDDHIHVKINSHWKIKSPKPTSVLALEPTWNYPIPFFRIVPGIADLTSESDSLPTNPQIFFPLKNESYMVKISKLDPLLYFLESPNQLEDDPLTI